MQRKCKLKWCDSFSTYGKIQKNAHTLSYSSGNGKKKTISIQHYNEEQFFCGKQFWVIIMLYEQARIVWFLER